MQLNSLGDKWTINCPAKLNLFLQVHNKRDDGYHEIDTVMTLLDVYDTLIFSRSNSNEINLQCKHNSTRYRRINAVDDVPSGPSNLVLKAANLMKAIGQPSTGLNIELHKRTPAAAGMAGGSSNAAATIIALNEIWEMRLPRVELQKIATLLGSDIAFFLSPTSLATCRGRGEVIIPHHNNCRLHFVIARPTTGLSTALVYQHFKPTNSSPDSTPLSAALQTGDIRSIGQNMQNALQPVAEKLNPEIAHLRKAFSKLPVYSHMMTGSGTAYFGLCQTRSQACTAATRLKATGLDRVFVAQCPS